MSHVACRKVCGVTTPENLWRDWAKKNNKKLDFYSKYPSYPYRSCNMKHATCNMQHAT